MVYTSRKLAAMSSSNAISGGSGNCGSASLPLLRAPHILLAMLFNVGLADIARQVIAYHSLPLESATEGLPYIG